MNVQLAIANGDYVKVHAANCADLNKSATRREAYNGIYKQTFEAGTDERDVWIDYNQDFLAEGGAEGAWDLKFMPCCFTHTELRKNADRSWSE